MILGLLAACGPEGSTVRAEVPSTEAATLLRDDGSRVYHLAVDGDDGAAGTTAGTALATLDEVHRRLVAESPSGPVEVRIAAGTYLCREMAEPWTFHNGQPIVIGPDAEVSAPAKDHAEDPDRPWFEGRDADGEPCPGSVWLTVRHDGSPMHLTVEGLAVTRYRGGVTIKAGDGVTADPDLAVTLHNLVLERIGDKYHHREHADGTWLEGKGAVLLTRASGVAITGSWFHHVRNVEDSAGLVHALYFTSHASRNRVEGNTFHGGTGALVKLTDWSNGNVFLDNQLSHAPHGLRDRWCGAAEDPEERCGGEAQCPSWENVFPYERNTWSSLDAGDPVTVLDIPEGQTCAHPPPESGVRMDLGEGGVIEGG